jgi:hypothetical protein
VLLFIVLQIRIFYPMNVLNVGLIHLTRLSAFVISNF